MTFEAATPDAHGPPPITRIALSIVPCPLPRRAKWVRSPIASPSARPSPVIRRVGARISTFEACSDSHSRYGPMFRSTAQGGLCHEASAQPVAQPSRSSATRSIDNSPGGSFLHWRCAPSGRTDYLDISKRVRNESGIRLGRRSRIDATSTVATTNCS